MTRGNITGMITPLAAAALVVGVGTSAAGAPGATGSGNRPGQAGQRACVLGPNRAIKHVIYIQFDNTHYTRDNPAVLLGAAFHGVPINARIAAALIRQGGKLLTEAARLAR